MGKLLPFPENVWRDEMARRNPPRESDKGASIRTAASYHTILVY